MKILLIIDQFDSANNGTTISARRFAKALRQLGNEVRVVATGAPGADKYSVKALFLPPVVKQIVTRQGMEFALPNEEALRSGLAWCDVAHFMMPFFLCHKGLRLAEEMGVPHTAAFHVQPENITSTVGLGGSRRGNDAIYAYFRDYYNRFDHIHCPSRFIANQLVEHGYTSQLHVISNGIDPLFSYCKREKPAEWQDRLVVLMVGRYSVEKRQEVLIDAVTKSKYADRIQLVLAGQGPREHFLRNRASVLSHPPLFGFFSETDLHELMGCCDLYVHTADAEIEAISCIEAFASGLVPVIADSPKSATPQFALDTRSLFPAGDSGELAAKMDYWFDHAQDRARMERLYAERGEQYHLDACVRQAQEMFETAIRDARPDGEEVSHA